jgi:phosphoribosylformylglycinamidine (FGAM) synthase-like enzyme
VDCNSRYVWADPAVGCAIAVAEAARNIVCTGGVPSGVTNCLNFGNPYDKGVFYQFKNAIEGMGNACRKFNTPVTGGNVSFYNQSTDGEAVFPTPTIGMVGMIEKQEHIMTLDFKNEGDLIYLLGENKNDISSSQYLAKYKKIDHSPAPYFNLDKEYDLQQITYKLITEKQLQSCHDLSEGGLFVALLESAMCNDLGFDITTDASFRRDAILFGEAQSRIIVTVSPDKKTSFENAMNDSTTSFALLGKVQGKSMKIDGIDFGTISEYRNLYDNAIGNILEGNL